MSRMSYPWMTSLPTLSDAFCGCGGSSSGAERAGAIIQLGINHNVDSLTTHQYNFPFAQHRIEDITELSPYDPPHPLMSWWSPECKFHSPSRGKKLKGLDQPVLWECGELDEIAERSRMCMDQVWRWAEAKVELGVPYQIIFVENVVEVHHWHGFDRWLRKLISLGYDYRELNLNSLCFGVPQSRDRVYFVFWRKRNCAPKLDFLPQGYCRRCAKVVDCLQLWKNQFKRWGKYRVQYTYNCEYCLREVHPFHVPAASIINWQKPATKIGERTKPLADSTMERIQKGIERFSDFPFVLETCHNQTSGAYIRSVLSPCFTQTTAQSMGIAIPDEIQAKKAWLHASMPFMVAHGNPDSAYTHSDVAPLSLHPAGPDKAQLFPDGTAPSRPHPFLVSYYSNGKAYPPSQPLCTVSTRDRNGLCLPPVGTTTLSSSLRDINEWRFRMLDRYEVQRAMGFDSDYQIIASSEREAVRQLGLAVTPAVAEWLVQAALESLS